MVPVPYTEEAASSAALGSAGAGSGRVWMCGVWCCTCGMERGCDCAHLGCDGVRVAVCVCVCMCVCACSRAQLYAIVAIHMHLKTKKNTYSRRVERSLSTRNVERERPDGATLPERGQQHQRQVRDALLVLMPNTCRNRGSDCPRLWLLAIARAQTRPTGPRNKTAKNVPKSFAKAAKHFFNNQGLISH